MSPEGNTSDLCETKHRGSGSDDDGQDNERLCLPSLDKTTSSPLQGLVLERVLGFALKDMHDYACYSGVNKEWERMVHGFDAFVMAHVKARNSQGYSRSTSSKKWTNIMAKDMRLFRAVLQLLGSRTPNIYRSHSKKPWPSLEPDCYLALYDFVYGQWASHWPTGLTEQVTTDFFMSVAKKMATNIKESVLEEDKPLQDGLKDLVAQWEAWNGTIRNYTTITKPLHGNRIMIEGIMCMTLEELHKAVLWPRLVRFLDEVEGDMNNIPRPLLLSALGAIREAEGLAVPPRLWVEGAILQVRLGQDRLKQIRVAMEVFLGLGRAAVEIH